MPDILTEYVIWSIEHQAWWPATRMGYVPTLALAGRFSYDEAAAIVAQANIVKCHECMIPIEAFGEYFLPPRTRITPAMIAAIRRDVALGAGHECAEWTVNSQCVICDREAPSITCPRCGSVSYNLHDIEERYCGRCHRFHEEGSL